jgi:hypothetical protein
MIKFRCGHCNQKLGVPDEWGGKRIRCNHCKESCLVPLSQTRPQSQPETAPEADPATVLIQMDLPQEEGGDGFPSHLLDFQSGKVVPREDWPPAPIVPRDAIQVSVRRAELAESRPRWGLSVAAKGTLQIPLAVVVSLGCTLAAAFVWGKVASTVQFRLNILAILVAGAAGLGLVAVLRRQHVGIGIMAAIIGMVGVFSGKWFIGQWLVMPAFQEAVNARIDLMNSLPMSKTGMSDFLDDPEVVQDCICLQLSDNGQITPETAEKLILSVSPCPGPGEQCAGSGPGQCDGSEGRGRMDRSQQAAGDQDSVPDPPEDAGPTNHGEHCGQNDIQCGRVCGGLFPL